jgi:hypothetical protein
MESEQIERSLEVTQKRRKKKKKKKKKKKTTKQKVKKQKRRDRNRQIKLTRHNGQHSQQRGECGNSHA